MKVFEEIEIGQQVTQVTEESGTWSNISYDAANNGYYDEYDGEEYYVDYGQEEPYNALPVNPMNIVGINSGADIISNPSIPTLTVISGQPKVTF